MNKKFYLLFFIYILLFSPTYSQKNKDPQANLKALWELMDKNYGNFSVKNLDWKKIYLDESSILPPNANNKQLFEAMVEMVKPLDDGHVILSGGPRVYVSGMEQSYSLTRPMALMKARKEYTVGNFSLEAIEKRYMIGKLNKLMDGNFHYGWINDEIGYFHFKSFTDINGSEKVIDQLMVEFKDAKALIVDVRANTGGEDKVGKIIADRFADQRRIYMKACEKVPGFKNQFGPQRYWHIEPDGLHRFHRPVILLTSRTSISAAENFALAMHTLPNVTVVGDTTNGIFADTGPNELPNGWIITFPNTYFTNHEDICLEGIGVAPDVLEINTKAEAKRLTDRQLEKALKIIESGHYRVSKDRRSIMLAKEPKGIEALEKGIFSSEWKEAIAQLRKEYFVDKTGHYFFPEELEAISENLLKARMNKRAAQVLAFNLEIHPDATNSRKMLRRAE